MRCFRAVLFTAAGCLLSGAAGAQTINVTGLIDAGPSSNLNQMVLVGDRGFALAPFPMRFSNNFRGIDACNGDPIHCVPGSTLSLSATPSDSSYTITLDGVSYHGGCLNCIPSFNFQVSGSVVLPPLAPTATITGSFTFSGTFVPDPTTSQGVSLAGTGTVTLSLHSPSSPDFPNSWHIDRAQYRFDSPLPAPWLSVDVGAVGQPGSTSGTAATDGTWNVAGAGGDIWGAADAFRFAFVWPGANEIVARVDGEENTSPFAKAGLMMRPSFDPGAAHVVLDVKPDGGVEFMTRSTAGGATTYIAGAPASFPVWLKLTLGQGITASMSQDGKSWQVVGVTPVPNGFPPNGAPPPIAGLVVTSHDTSLVNHAVFSHVSAGSSIATPPPTPWLESDIGAVSQAGNTSWQNGTFTVTGDGSDIWGAADSFHYVYQPWSGDGSIVARVTGVQDTNTFAKAGVMLRSTVDASAADVILDMRPDGSVELMSRGTNGGDTTFIAGGAQPNDPLWLMLVRSGQVVSGYISADGDSWQAVGSVSVPAFAGGGVFAGLAVTSHDAGVLNTSTFDNVSVVQAQGIPAPWASQDVGSTGLAGSASFANGAFTIKGAGADIWGAADAFQFVYQAEGSATAHISARIVNEQEVNAFAKTGVMIRSSLSAGAAFVILDMKPDGSVEFMQRETDGGAVEYLGGASVGFGGWLGLDRNGSSVAASFSPDGSTWTTIGATSTAIPTSALAGIAVTSHDTNQLNTAVVDNVVVH
jgi:hypothetical protein